MYLNIRPALSATKISLSRTMSSLSPGHILQGTRWNYRILHPVKGDDTHISTVFKAEIISRENTRNAPEGPQWSVLLHRS